MMKDEISLIVNDLSISRSLDIHLCKQNPPVLKIHTTSLIIELNDVLI